MASESFSIESEVHGYNPVHGLLGSFNFLLSPSFLHSLHFM